MTKEDIPHFYDWAKTHASGELKSAINNMISSNNFKSIGKLVGSWAAANPPSEQALKAGGYRTGKATDGSLTVFIKGNEMSVLLHAPYTLSTLKGDNLKPNMVISVPCIKGYFQQVEALVNSGEIIQVADTFYLAPSQQSPRIARLPSLDIENDITLAQLHAMHLPTEQEATHDY